jgi:hypothetical protein
MIHSQCVDLHLLAAFYQRVYINIEIMHVQYKTYIYGTLHF